MGNAPKEIREVGIDDFPVSAKQQFFDLDCRLLGVPPRPVGVLFGWKIGFEDRLQHQQSCCHADPIPHVRDAQRSEFAVGLWIQHAIWLYLRFTLSYRDVEELLAERGLDISYETVRRWVLKFGPAIARRLRQRRPRPSDRWHLDEMVVRIAGERLYLWRAVDHEGEILDMLVQRRRDSRA